MYIVLRLALAICFGASVGRKFFPASPAYSTNNQPLRSTGAVKEVRSEELHICPACEGDLVYPASWQEQDDDRWLLSLRCPDCREDRTTIAPQDVVDRFDDVLNIGTDRLISVLEVTTRDNMLEYTERFSRALRLDMVLPEDF